MAAAAVNTTPYQPLPRTPLYLKPGQVTSSTMQTC